MITQSGQIAIDGNGLFCLGVVGLLFLVVVLTRLLDLGPAGSKTHIKPEARAADDCTLIVEGSVDQLQHKMHRVYSGGGVWTRTGSHEWTFKMNQPYAKYIAEAINRDEGEL